MELLDTVLGAVRAAASCVRTGSQPTDEQELMAALKINDDAVIEVLRPALTGALPGSGWNTDEHGSGPMPGGDWWVVDPVGGNMNAVQGIPDWNIGVALIRDGRAALAVLHTPAETFTAVAGGGAFRNGEPITVSAKTELSVALTGTGQAKAGTDPAYAKRFGASISAMMQKALYVRASVPVGRHLSDLAAGRLDAFWQFDNLRSHLGPLLIAAEAGATITDLDGRPWTITSPGYLAATPALHAETLEILRGAS